MKRFVQFMIYMAVASINYWAALELTKALTK